MSYAFSGKDSPHRDRSRAVPARPMDARAHSSPPRIGPTASPCACGGGCPRCRAQAKAHASGHDALERQADRVAEQVTDIRSAAHAVPIEPLPAPRVQAKRGGETTGGRDRIEQRVARERGGRPLPEPTRGFMEARFGADFSGVRVHAGGEAQRLNAELDARAFTYGPDIWLGANESAHDRRLMAHELTHVLQQSAAPPYIARQPKDEKKDDKQAGAGAGTTGTATAAASVSGCDKKTTGIDDAPAVLERARASALSAVRAARAAFKPLKSSTITLLDRHFHCPSTTQIQEVMKTLAAIEGALPTLTVNCLNAKDPDCAGSKGQAVDKRPELHACPGYFDQDVSDVFRAVTFVFATAAGIGRHQRCRREEACYDDFMQTASAMLNNPYSYAWFAVEAAGLFASPATDIVPCRPLEIGIYVTVPPAAKKDPTQIRRVSGFDSAPAGSEIASVWMDSGGKYFIYHDDIEGARAYLPGEPKKRYYFPEGKRP